MSTRISRLGAAALAVALAGPLASVSARAGVTADDERHGSTQSNIGALTGLVVGAAAAGPVGAVLGAAAGIVLGDRYHRQAQAAAALTSSLDKSEAQRARLAGSVGQLDETLKHTDELELSVSFRTDDDAVAVEAVAPLLKLGALAASLPQARLRVAGFADPRGTDAWNNDLSLRRAQNVAAVLSQAGVARERMIIEAHGSSAANCGDGDLDAYALERRVTVRLELAGSGQVARRD